MPNTSKSILITPGALSGASTSISQIDFKWYESGIGTFIFNRSPLDSRSTIYNWEQSGEPTLLFGGMGTYLGVQYSVSPYTDYVGSFSGQTAFPSVQILPISGVIKAKNLEVSGINTASFYYGSGLNLTNLNATNLTSGTVPGSVVSGTYSGITSVGNLTQLYVGGIVTSNYLKTLFIYDVNQSIGTVGQVLSSTLSGIAWTTASSGGGTITGSGQQNQIALWAGSSQLYGFSTFVYSNGNIGIGTASPNQPLHVQGNVFIAGITTANAYYGLGYNLTGLNASNLDSGIVPSSVVSGTYSGITSVGNLTQLYVAGITTADAYYGLGYNLTNLNATNLASGTVPSSVVSGTYSGITSVGNLTQLYVGGIVTSAALKTLSIYDINQSSGTTGQVLSSTASGIAWTTAGAGGGTVNGSGQASQIAFWASASQIAGISTFVYSANRFGLGTATPTQLAHIHGDLRVTGGIYDSLNNVGLAGSVLASDGTKIYWASIASGASSGILGTINQNQVAYGNLTNRIQGSNNLWFDGTNLGISNTTPKTTFDIKGQYVFDTKSVSLSTAYATVITVNMSDNTSAYVKITAHSNLVGYGPIGYVADLILQKGDANAYSQPGIILREDNNTYLGVYLGATIIDPGVGAGNTNIIISLGLSTGSLTSLITYEIRGQFNTVT